MRAMAIIALLAALPLATIACTGRDGDARIVRVFAAASLTQSFEEIATAFEAMHSDVKVELHCAGTPRLVLQLLQGAPADVFASADAKQMQRAFDGELARGAVKPFASNRLAIITEPDNPHGIQSLADLQRESVRVLLCGPKVPAGRYAREALAKAGVQIESRSDEPSVRAVVSKVQLGLVDAGIVYATDAVQSVAKSSESPHSVSIPALHNIVARYPIASLLAGSQPQLGEAFVAFVLGESGQRILASHGFGAP